MLLRTLILKVSGWGWMERFVRRSRLFRPVVRRFIGGDTLADGTVMAVEHQTLPVLGLQFHPDSFGTPRGREMLKAFVDAL